MSSHSSREREIREIAIAALSSEATDAQLARLDELIQEDAQLASYAAMVFDLQASLAWQGSMCDERPACSTLAELADPAASLEPLDRASRPADRRMISMHWAWPPIAVGIAFLLGTMVYPAMRSSGLWNITSADDATAPKTHAATYEARLIRSTACLWDINTVGSTEIGRGVNSGESLHLLEGLAEFTLEWSRGGNATLSLEGPAAMMLTSEGMPVLRFGRMTASINTSSRPFVLETPVGRLVTTKYGSIGVSAFGNEGEIHVFDGSAMLEPAWRSSAEEQDMPLRIEAGRAIRVQEGNGGELSFTEHAADPGYFVAQQSMDTDALVVPPTYVEAVMKARPIGYWRFERSSWPNLPNEKGKKFECRVNGSMGTTAHHGNQAVEFGVTDEDGEIVCDDLFGDALRDSYSIECWIKPSHYHVGAVISLISDPETPTSVIPHGMLLELGGTGLIPNALTLHHPGLVRFLHRSPASNEVEVGTSCYSATAYTLRKWQHIVAVKDRTHLRLFVNGQMAGEVEDSSQLPSNLRLLVGKLYPSRRVRPFIGQLDELAVYGRALEGDEIAPPLPVDPARTDRQTQYLVS